MMQAAFTFFSARCTPPITDAPTPNISPRPVITIHSGATMLTAAMPFAPTPCPTKMPSMSVCEAMNAMPTSVGKKSARNNAPIFPVPKSILSLLKSIFFISQSFYLDFSGCKITAFGWNRMQTKMESYGTFQDNNAEKSRKNA